MEQKLKSDVGLTVYGREFTIPAGTPYEFIQVDRHRSLVRLTTPAVSHHVIVHLSNDVLGLDDLLIETPPEPETPFQPLAKDTYVMLWGSPIMIPKGHEYQLVSHSDNGLTSRIIIPILWESAKLSIEAMVANEVLEDKLFHVQFHSYDLATKKHKHERAQFLNWTEAMKIIGKFIQFKMEQPDFGEMHAPGKHEDVDVFVRITMRDTIYYFTVVAAGTLPRPYELEKG